MGTRIVVEWSRGYKDKNGGRGGGVSLCVRVCVRARLCNIQQKNVMNIRVA